MKSAEIEKDVTYWNDILNNVIFLQDESSFDETLKKIKSCIRYIYIYIFRLYIFISFNKTFDKNASSLTMSIVKT